LKFKVLASWGGFYSHDLGVHTPENAQESRCLIMGVKTDSTLHAKLSNRKHYREG